MAFRSQPPQEANFSMQSSASIEPGSAIEYSADALVVRAFVQEVHTAAMLAVGATSAINLTQTIGSAVPLIATRNLVHGFKGSIDHWPQRILDEQLTQDTVEHVTDFFAAFRRGDARLLDFEVDAQEIGSERAAPLHILNLASIWRTAATQALAVTQELRRDAQDVLPTEYAAAADLLKDVLERVINGSTEFCQTDGTFVLPQLSERRRMQRQSLLQAVKAVSEGHVFHAFAKDISSGGMGLTRMPRLDKGSKISVELKSGRTFAGTVAWSRNGEIGVTFDTPLSLTDPLIFG